jgi:hypothetical protein
MKNIHVLPTDKPSRLFEILKFNFVFDNQNKYSEEYKKIHKYKNQNIYITNDEEIKEGDWFYVKTPDIYGGNIIAKSLGNSNGCWADNILTETTDEKGYHPSHCVKIILTTDQDLDNVQAIDAEFLEWFVKNPSCERVDVVYERIVIDEVRYNFDVVDYKYKIIIPEEELHSMDDEVECNMCGGYMYLLPDNSMYVCTNSECTRCYEEEDEEPKQETLEEAKQEQKQHLIDLMRLDEQETLEDFIKSIYPSPSGVKIRGIELGAKWQQEQDKNKYSEEEVLNILDSYKKRFLFFQNSQVSFLDFKEWFEKFKKK